MAARMNRLVYQEKSAERSSAACRSHPPCAPATAPPARHCAAMPVRHRPAHRSTIRARQFQPQRHRQPYPRRQAQPGQVARRHGRRHLAVFQVDPGFHQGRRAAREQQFGVLRVGTCIEQPAAQGRQSPAQPANVWEHGQQRRVTLGQAFRRRGHDRPPAPGCSARASSSLNPKRRKSVTRMGYSIPFRWSYSCCTTPA